MKSNPTRNPTSIRLTKDMLSMIDKLAETHFRTRNEQIAYMLSYALDHIEEPETLPPELPKTDKHE